MKTMTDDQQAEVRNALLNIDSLLFQVGKGVKEPHQALVLIALYTRKIWKNFDPERLRKHDPVGIPL